VVATATVDGFLTLETFSFTGFDDLVSVTWFQGGGPPESPTHQFDIVVVEPVSVPEPSPLALLGLGAAALAGWHWCRGSLIPTHRRAASAAAAGGR
jgi:hypothetical protein